ncbi:MAG TPA: response regulator transcription factor [Blastocatellia bacterium]|nr:response regulator transcription factor [Blastocatellia bacterium]
MTTDTIKIFIADDHPIFRSGLRQLIETSPQMTVIGEARDGAEAIERLLASPADVALLDIDMPQADGFEVLTTLREKGSNLQFVFLTMHKDEQFLNAALDLGVKGFLVKDSAAEEVIDCINAVVKGQEFISPQLTSLLLKRLRHAQENPAQPTLLDELTPTERKVLKLIAQFKTSKEIAAELFMGVRTVEQHRLNISEKFNLKGRHALVKFVTENFDRLKDKE